MNINKYLKQTSSLKENIKYLEEKIVMWKIKAQSLSASTYTPSYLSNRPEEAAYEKVIAHIMMLEEEVAKARAKLTERIIDLETKLNKLESLECRMVLSLRYVEFMSMTDIASRLNYSVRWVQKLHNKGLNELSEIVRVSSQ